MNKRLCMIMAGGKGSRLGPLTCHRAKPGAPFGGRYRIIDFVLSNMVNSGFQQIYVLTQYMASSLIQHLNRNWHFNGPSQFIEVVPAQMRTGNHWYLGTADAVYQNINLIRDARVDHIAIFGGDHVYKFAIDQMEREHLRNEAHLTISAFPIPVSQAHHFGIMQVDEAGRVIAFQEKPKENPATIPGRPDLCLASMGNYFFRSDVLIDALVEDAKIPSSSHDFGKDVIPRLLGAGQPIYAYDFGQNSIPGEPESAPAYWRDVGTLDSYFDANMDVRSLLPALNLYNRAWRIRTAQRDYPPARFIRDESGYVGQVEDSLICEGSIVVGGNLSHSLISYDCFVLGRAELQEVITMSGCNIGAGAKLSRVLMDKNCSVEAGAELGLNPAIDRNRFPFITESGVIILPKGTHVPKTGPIEFAQDIGQLLETDDATKEAMINLNGQYHIAQGRVRHSFTSAGPRYERYREHGRDEFRPSQPVVEDVLK